MNADGNCFADMIKLLLNMPKRLKSMEIQKVLKAWTEAWDMEIERLKTAPKTNKNIQYKKYGRLKKSREI